MIFPIGKGRRRRKDFVPALLLTIAIALLISPRLRYYALAVFDYPLHYREYRNFNIRIPTGYSVHGIDVSRYQERVDWERVAAMRVGTKRIHFAFVKATEGTWLQDPWFDFNWANTRKHGIVRGAYHYFLPDLNPRDQARHFTGTVRLRSGDLPPVVDVEERRGMSREQVRKFTKEFLDLLQRHYGIKPIVYTNRDFYKNHFADQPEFKPYVFWIAHYHVADLSMPDGSKWHFWQHSDRGRVNGINSDVDFNVFYSDSLTLRKLCVP